MNITRKNFIIAFVVLLVSLTVINPTVFAESKKKLEQIVFEHESKIQALVNDVTILKNKPAETKQELTEETKQTLLKEYRGAMQYLGSDDLQIGESKIIERNGEYVFQVYTEGAAGYTHQPENVWYFESGKVLAFNLTQNFNTINKMYNVELSIEFIHNGEKITTFARP